MVTLAKRAAAAASSLSSSSVFTTGLMISAIKGFLSGDLETRLSKLVPGFLVRS